jgi:NAD-dependent deacetylase
MIVLLLGLINFYMTKLQLFQEISDNLRHKCVDMRKKLVVLTGAGVSAESGLKTFRDSDGLWENYRVEEVASIEGWYRNPSLMLDFYNQRRRQLENAKPNGAHKGLAKLESRYDVCIVTQNVDNLHEKAGSSNVLHLHGELTKACSSRDKSHVTDIGYRDILIGEKAADGSQLRPYIVWFGEEVPELGNAIYLASSADVFVIIGTSLNVYPAAGLIDYVPSECPIYIIDPNQVGRTLPKNCTVIREQAVKGVGILSDYLESLL